MIKKERRKRGPHSVEHKAKISRTMLGMKQSAATKRKKSISARKRWANLEQREAHSKKIIAAWARRRGI